MGCLSAGARVEGRWESLGLRCPRQGLGGDVLTLRAAAAPPPLRACEGLCSVPASTPGSLGTSTASVPS